MLFPNSACVCASFEPRFCLDVDAAVEKGLACYFVVDVEAQGSGNVFVEVT